MNTSNDSDMEVSFYYKILPKIGINKGITTTDTLYIQGSNYCGDSVWTIGTILLNDTINNYQLYKSVAS